MKSKPAPSKRRVTLRTIAKAAGVSVMTVSYALRKSEEVSPETRLRIRKVAESLGYRPDPLLTHLMEHLRSQRKLKSAANLAVLTSLRAPFVQRLLSGVTSWAERMGYQIDVIDTREFARRSSPTLTRMLVARGVSGVLLGPAAAPASYRGLVEWERFSVVAMTYSVVDPHVHRVVPHHFDNALKTFGLLEQRGYRRIGFAMRREMELRTNHSYSAAYFRMVGQGAAERLPILMLDEADKKEICSWFSTTKPHAVVVTNAHHARDIIWPAIGPGLARETPFVTLDYEDDIGISGIDQMFDRIGSHSVEALVAQIHRNERGLPEHPTITMVEGTWREAPAQAGAK